MKNIVFNAFEPYEFEEKCDYIFALYLLNYASDFEKLVCMCKAIAMNLKEDGEAFMIV